MSRLDPLSLRLFIAVVESGTIAAAAEREHIAAAAVSKRITELESLLSTQLLSRSNKGVEATAAGQTLASLARRALHQFDDIFMQMRDYASGVRGYVRVFANISAITQFLPAELKSFRLKYPQVHVTLEERISTVITRAVADNTADIGIFTHSPQSFDIECFPYHRDRLVLLMPPEHSLAGAKALAFVETLNCDYVGLHTGSAINNVMQNAAHSAQLPLKMVMQVTGYDALCLMVHAGLGIGVLPERVAEQHCVSLGLKWVSLRDAWAQRELSLCVRSFDKLPVAARLLVNHLRNQCPA